MDKMKIKNHKLIAECSTYDYKKEVEKKKVRDWIKSISGFANTFGGSLYFGVEDDGNIIGLSDIKSDSEFISEKIKAHLDPVPRFQLIPHETEDEKNILEVAVEAGTLSPYYLFMDGSRMAYLRIGNESVPADAHQLQELVLRGTGRSWDTLVSDIKRNEKTFLLLAETYQNRIGQPLEEKFLGSFGLVSSEGYLTNAGLLYADECPVYQSRVFCTRWNGLKKTDALNDAEFQGNIIRLLKNSLDFIKANTAKRWYKLPTYRLNFPEYSERAITEAIVNHLVHRQYTIIGGELHIDIYDDRIEFVTPGGMVDGSLIQDLDLSQVSSPRRNPILADVLTHLDLMEKRGSGLERIIDLTAQLHTYTDDKKPHFQSSQSMFYSIIPNVNYGLADDDFEKIVEERRINDAKSYPVTAEKPVKETIKTGTVAVPTKRLGTTAQKILDAMTDNPTVTREALVEITGVGEDAVKKQISRLVAQGIIIREGSKKNGKWVVLIRK